MNPFEYIKALDHHAYFIHSFNNSVQRLKDYLNEKFHIPHHQNPDFFHEKFEVLGIGESRRIKENHLSKSFIEDNKRIFIIEANSITHEAQNSLLKIFEEPHEHSHFFLIMPSTEILLPTLRSRLSVISHNISDDVEETYTNKEIQTFLKLNNKGKVDYVDRIAKDIADEKLTKNDAIKFLGALEKEIYNTWDIKNSKTTQTLRVIIKARDYINDRSSSVKQLLEYVALNV